MRLHTLPHRYERGIETRKQLGVKTRADAAKDTGLTFTITVTAIRIRHA